MEFLENKYSRWYFKIVEKAKIRNWSKKTANCYIEFHHIVPICLGGKNLGVVSLTYKEHFICHRLLVKMTAAIEMSRGRVVSEETKQKLRAYNIGKKIPSEIKEKIKQSCIKRWSDPVEREKQSQKQSGCNNGMFGKSHTQEVKDKLAATLSKTSTLYWTGRKRLTQMGENNISNKPEIKKKISDSIKYRYSMGWSPKCGKSWVDFKSNIDMVG